MPSLLDLLFGSGADPYALAAQLGTTPRNIQQPVTYNPNSGQLPPTSIVGPGAPAAPPSMQSVPNPAYQQLQKQLATAQRSQNERALGMGLLQGGAAMMGARSPNGYPAPFGSAIATGMQSGVQGAGDYLTRARKTSRDLMQAQLQGQQVQLNQFQLQQAQELTKRFGMPTVDAAKLVTGEASVAAMQKALTGIAKDANTPPDVKQRAQFLANSLTGTSTLPANFASTAARELYAPPMSKAEQDYLASGTSRNNAMGSYYGALEKTVPNARLEATVETGVKNKLAALAKGESPVMRFLHSKIGGGIDMDLAPGMVEAQHLARAGLIPWPAGLPHSAPAVNSHAYNPETGEMMIGDGLDWLPVTAPKKTPSTTATP
jgi:hypothetical protein